METIHILWAGLVKEHSGGNMSKYAYIESTSGDVWSVASQDLSIAEVITITGLTQLDEKINNCPDNLLARGSAQSKFHRKTSGDGTVITDYELITNPDYYTPISTLLSEKGPVVDENSKVIGEYAIMQTLANRRELFNDEDNPLYDPTTTPILGEQGILESQGGKVNNLESIHSKLAWHQQEITKAAYHGPEDLLFYYGWMNGFNYDYNGWNNEYVAQDMARYDIIVLGDGIQNPGHGDFANTSIIIPRIKAINPTVRIFGYVSASQVIEDFQTKVDQWDDFEVAGIFMDECGYDYGNNRAAFNTRVDYVHGKTYCNRCFVNAWNTDHILGTTDDTSYPNSTWNPSLVESNLWTTDIMLLESLGVNTVAYTDTGLNGHEPKAQWAARISKATALRAQYGVDISAVSIIANSTTNGHELFRFGFLSALMGSFDSYGSSDASYASGSAIVKKWNKPDIKGLRPVWSLNPSIQVDAVDSDIYKRCLDNGTIGIDFSLNAHKAWLSPPPGKLVENYGFVDFSSESTKSVVFDNIYLTDVVSLQLTPGGNINTWFTDLTTTGFTLHLSTTWTGRVYWYAKGN